MLKFDSTEKVIAMLLADDVLAKNVNGNIRPVVAKYGTTIPYIVVSTENASVNRMKFGAFSVMATVLVTIVTNSFGDLRRMVDRMCAKDGKEFDVEGYKEDYGEDNYVAQLTINLEY